MKTMKRKIMTLSIVALTCLAMSTCAQKNEDNKNRDGNNGGHRYHGKHGRKNSYKSGAMADRIYIVTQADSIQARKMKPAVDKASDRVKALREEYQRKEKVVMDSLRLLVKPFLKEDQNKRLDDFSERKGSHRGH
jgi:hypothetical protein